MRSLILLPLLFCMVSCTWWQAYKTAETIIENYPSDNIIEEVVEEHIEDYFDLEDGSIDLSPFSPEA